MDLCGISRKILSISFIWYLVVLCVTNSLVTNGSTKVGRLLWWQKYWSFSSIFRTLRPTLMKLYCSSCFLSVWNGYLLHGKLTCAFWSNFTKQRWNFKWKWWCFEILLKGYKIMSLTSKGRYFNGDFRMNFKYWLTVVVVHFVFAVGLLFNFAKLPRPPWSTIAPERKRRCMEGVRFAVIEPGHKFSVVRYFLNRK